MKQFASYFQANYEIKTDGSVVMRNGHATTPQKALAKYREGLEALGHTCDITVAQVEEYVRNNTPVAAAKPVFSLEAYILEYLHRYADPSNIETCRWKIGSDWRTIEQLKNGVPYPSDISELHTAIRAEAVRAGLGKVAKSDDIKVLLYDLATKKSCERVEGISKKLKYDPNCVEILHKCLDELHDFWGVKQSKDVFRIMTMHWMCQVKRKVLGLNTPWALWINYYGGTGIGKTKYLEDFAAPFGDFSMLTSISKLLDEERQIAKLTSSFIINLDELSVNNRETQYSDKDATLSRDQQATLKSLLTQTKNTTRVMGGQKQATRRLTFSCISSANEHLYDIIYDEKTMRRYFEFECTVDRVTDFKRLEQIKEHILEMWRGVDESREDGYWNPQCSVWKEVAEEQSRYYPTNTTTANWITARGVEACSPEQRERVQDLFDDYKIFCKERGNYSKSQSKWATDIRHLVPGASNGSNRLNIRTTIVSED